MRSDEWSLTGLLLSLSAGEPLGFWSFSLVVGVLGEVRIVFKVETASLSSLHLVGRICSKAPGCQIAGAFCHLASRGRWKVSGVTDTESILG